MLKKIKGYIKPIQKKISAKKYAFKIFFRKKRNAFIIRQNIKAGIFPVEIISGMGFFGNLTFTLYILKYCEEKKLTPFFKFTLENSSIKGNPFDYFFKIKTSKKIASTINYAKMKSWDDLNMDIDWTKYQNLTIKSAGALINEHFTINKNVIEKVDAFYNDKLKNKKVLGLHYRATDKKNEANILPYNFLIKQLDVYLDKYPETDLIFVSTDDINFLEFLKSNFFKVPITYNKDSFRSNDNKSTHLSCILTYC